MKFFIAHLATETNTFAAAPTGQGDFEEIGIYHGMKAPAPAIRTAPAPSCIICAA
jgi:microcystin degradation protein MlrC